MSPAVDVRERPILFSGPMVRAILDGSKTQTRRVVKPQPEDLGDGDVRVRVGKQWHSGPASYLVRDVLPRFGCPYGQPGDRPWVRETWANAWCGDRELHCYAADHSDEIVRVEKWKPSIHMPRRLSRITLELTGVRVERLQDISNEDCRAEGIGDGEAAPYIFNQVDDYPRRQAYRALWDSLNAQRGYSWDVNPWVWVLEFRKVTT